MPNASNPEFLDRYRRHILMKNIGGIGQRKLGNASESPAIRFKSMYKFELQEQEWL